MCVSRCVQEISVGVQKSQHACLPCPGGADCANINSKVVCPGAPSQNATRQLRVGLSGKLSLYSLMAERSERKHIGVVPKAGTDELPWIAKLKTVTKRLFLEIKTSNEVCMFFYNWKNPLKFAKWRARLERCCKQNYFLHCISSVQLDGFCIFMKYLVLLGFTGRAEMYFLSE